MHLLLNIIFKVTSMIYKYTFRAKEKKKRKNMPGNLSRSRGLYCSLKGARRSIAIAFQCVRYLSSNDMAPKGMRVANREY